MIRPSEHFRSAFVAQPLKSGFLSCMRKAPGSSPKSTPWDLPICCVLSNWIFGISAESALSRDSSFEGGLNLLDRLLQILDRVPTALRRGLRPGSTATTRLRGGLLGLNFELLLVLVTVLLCVASCLAFLGRGGRFLGLC